MKTRKSSLIRGRDRGVRCTGLFLAALWLDLGPATVHLDAVAPEAMPEKAPKISQMKAILSCVTG